MSRGELRGAMIGAGFFAQFHVDGWNRLPGVKITAVADTDSARRAAFCEQWGIAAHYASAEDMIERERPDFVDIVTRPDSHLALTRLAAGQGVHVICQKPMAASMEECRQMVEACRAAGVRLLMHENWRWQPWYREVGRLIAAGRFGRIYHVAFRVRTGDGRGAEPYGVQPYFRQMPRLLIYELLVHFLDTFRYLAGEIETVFCAIDRLNPVIRGEDYALIQVRFAGGAHGLIDANRISGDTPPKVAYGQFHLEGEKASIRMTPDGDLWLTEYGSPEAAHRFEKPENGYKGDSVRAVEAHLLECLLSGGRAESEGEEYLKTVAAVEACYRSVSSGMEEKAR